MALKALEITKDVTMDHREKLAEDWKIEAEPDAANTYLSGTEQTTALVSYLSTLGEVEEEQTAAPVSAAGQQLQLQLRSLAPTFLRLDGGGGEDRLLRGQENVLMGGRKLRGIFWRGGELRRMGCCW